MSESLTEGAIVRSWVCSVWKSYRVIFVSPPLENSSRHKEQKWDRKSSRSTEKGDSSTYSFCQRLNSKGQLYWSIGSLFGKWPMTAFKVVFTQLFPLSWGSMFLNSFTDPTNFSSFAYVSDQPAQFPRCCRRWSLREGGLFVSQSGRGFQSSLQGLTESSHYCYLSTSPLC